MLPCPYLEGCEFLSRTISDIPEMACLMKARHCERGYYTCARYLVAEAIGPNGVPVDLYPNQTGKAQMIVEARRKPPARSEWLA